MNISAFLQISDIPGESTDSKYTNWIELQGFEVAGSQQQTGQSRSVGGALTSGRSTMAPFKIKKLVDKASPKLFSACMTGQHINKVVLAVARQTGKGLTEYLNYQIESCLVTSFQDHGSTSIADGTDDISPMAFEVVEFIGVKHTLKYTETAPDGSTKGSVESNYDQSKNSGS